MRIKHLLGICECKGCKKIGIYGLKMEGTRKNGKPLKIKGLLCEQHAMEIIHNGRITSVSFETEVK